MYKTNHKHSALLILIISLLLASSGMNHVHAATTMEVTPPASNVAPLDTFKANITINDVTNLTGLEFKLFFLNTVLNCTGVTEGPFLKSGGSTFKVFNITNNYNTTHGRILAACTLTGLDVSVNGSGVAATITFKALFIGSTALDLVDTKLTDEKIPPKPIAHTAIDGFVYVGGVEVHDITVTNVTTTKDGCKPLPTVPDNMFVKVNVTVLNKGNMPETFTVTLHANTTVVETQPVTALVPASQITLFFRWNTSGWARGSYTISASAEVTGDANQGDNTFTNGAIRVVVPGDISGDRIVDIFDAILMANSYNTTPQSSSWNPNADIKTDDVIDIFDAIVLATNYNQTE